MLARRHGLSEHTLYRWRDAFLTGDEAALSNGKGKAYPCERQIGELKKQLGEQDQIIGESTIANRLLKRTAAPSF